MKSLCTLLLNGLLNGILLSAGVFTDVLCASESFQEAEDFLQRLSEEQQVHINQLMIKIWQLDREAQSKALAHLETYLREAPIKEPFHHYGNHGWGSTEKRHLRLQNGILTFFKHFPKHCLTGEEDCLQREVPEFEVTAYKLSRFLGLNFVPVAVHRTIEDKFGTLQMWVPQCEDAFCRDPENFPQSLQKQSLMRLFDYLIFNADRHPQNFMIHDEGHLVAIDHGWSFHHPTEFNTYAPFLPEDVFENLEFQSHFMSLKKADLREILTRGKVRTAMIDLILTRYQEIKMRFQDRMILEENDMPTLYREKPKFCQESLVQAAEAMFD